MSEDLTRKYYTGRDNELRGQPRKTLNVKDDASADKVMWSYGTDLIFEIRMTNTDTTNYKGDPPEMVLKIISRRRSLFI